MQTALGPTHKSPNQDNVQVLKHSVLLHCYTWERRTKLDRLPRIYQRISKFRSRCEWKSRLKFVECCHVFFRFPSEGLVCGWLCLRSSPKCIIYSYIYMCIWMHVWIQKYQVRPNIDLGSKSSHWVDFAKFTIYAYPDPWGKSTLHAGVQELEASILGGLGDPFLALFRKFTGSRFPDLNPVLVVTAILRSPLHRVARHAHLTQPGKSASCPNSSHLLQPIMPRGILLALQTYTSQGTCNHVFKQTHTHTPKTMPVHTHIMQS